ncbi:alpha/beta-hydrolase [Fistulina hepatica ATCC 64428]|uniref:Alpha/beta-hydrolase n=1 Tax=Fistulina hepatica ATCC 64428 TaxID=1128425 RepID=A0A0D7AG32_9AGAR|nr:alpha/beta-hydrolase [Fistulina hepatica ATCC 64428]
MTDGGRGLTNFLPSLGTLAKGTFATAASLSTIGIGLLYYGQNYLIYPSAFPAGSRTHVPVPSDYGIEYEDLALKTSDGIILRCYLLLQSKKMTFRSAFLPGEEFMSTEELIASRPTVIMFHGNGGNHGHRIPLASVFYSKMRCNVLMMSYPSYRYGLSEGSPSEQGLIIDAQTGLDYILSNPILASTPIILYGQSIGGAVAIDLASKNSTKITAMILENTFTSLPAVVPSALPLLGPLAFLCREKWDSASKIPLIPASIPILMLSGSADQLIPKEHMHALWDLVANRRQGSTGEKSERGKFLEFKRGDHNDTCVQPGYWQAVADFVASLSNDAINAADMIDDEQKMDVDEETDREGLKL